MCVCVGVCVCVCVCVCAVSITLKRRLWLMHCASSHNHQMIYCTDREDTERDRETKHTQKDGKFKD